jgi:hypothetical protein
MTESLHPARERVLSDDAPRSDQQGHRYPSSQFSVLLIVFHTMFLHEASELLLAFDGPCFLLLKAFQTYLRPRPRLRLRGFDFLLICRVCVTIVLTSEREVLCFYPLLGLG